MDEYYGQKGAAVARCTEIVQICAYSGARLSHYLHPLV